MTTLKYKLLGNILNRNLSNPKIYFCTYLKIFILENEFLGGELEKYFKQMYRIINRMPHHLLYFIGSYNHFDTNRAELLFMDLLEKVIVVNERDEETIRIDGLQEGLTIKLKKKVRLPKFTLEGIATESEKVPFH
jgi:hypothetical protein